MGNNSKVDVTYKFDALGRRVYRDDGTTVMVYVQVGQQTIADYVAGTVATSPDYNYVYASYIDEPIMRDDGSAKLYYHRNQQYSIVALTDGSGSIVERYAYSAYGVPTLMNSAGLVLSSSGFDNRYTYTGREWDEDFHLYHYRARMYDSNLGRFCSTDPIRYADGYNQFAYVASQPLKKIDPTGNTSVVLTPSAPEYGPFRPCVDLRTASWTLSLDGTTDEDGWIVQKLCISCAFANCPCGIESHEVATWERKDQLCLLEAFRFKGGKVDEGVSDTFQISGVIREGQCGFVKMTGTMFFVSDGELAAAGVQPDDVFTPPLSSGGLRRMRAFECGTYLMGPYTRGSAAAYYFDTMRAAAGDGSKSIEHGATQSWKCCCDEDGEFLFYPR